MRHDRNSARHRLYGNPPPRFVLGGHEDDGRAPVDFLDVGCIPDDRDVAQRRNDLLLVGAFDAQELRIGHASGDFTEDRSSLVLTEVDESHIFSRGRGCVGIGIDRRVHDDRRQTESSVEALDPFAVVDRSPSAATYQGSDGGNDTVATAAGYVATIA